MENYMSREYWLWQAKATYEMIEKYPEQRWERHMYFYLFKWAGCDE
jgi:hypothetical protein